MDISGISQAMIAGYENSKTAKEAEKKNAGNVDTSFTDGAAAEYTKAETEKTKNSVKYNAAMIEKMKAEAALKTAQLRSLVEKMLLKQGEKFSTLADAFDMVKEGTIEVDDETAKEAAKEVTDDGYWGVEQTSERLFSFAKALSGNDPSKADLMMEALQTGYEQAAEQWGGELPELCQRTLETAKKKLADWRDGITSDVEANNKNITENVTS